MPSSTVCIVASLEWISVVAACMLGMCFDRSTPKHLTEIISAGISVMSSTIRSCFFFFERSPFGLVITECLTTNCSCSTTDFTCSTLGEIQRLWHASSRRWRSVDGYQDTGAKTSDNGTRRTSALKSTVLLLRIPRDDKCQKKKTLELLFLVLGCLVRFCWQETFWLWVFLSDNLELWKLCLNDFAHWHWSRCSYHLNLCLLRTLLLIQCMVQSMSQCAPTI